MSNERFGYQSVEVKGGKLDADAMCTQCGTVNPEGTLICRTCGNNLRDQRQIRMEADRILEGETRPWWQRQGLLIALIAGGAIFLLIVALNVGSLTEWVMSSQAVTASEYWEGANAPVFDAMLAELDAAALTSSQMDEIVTQPPLAGTEEGLFVLAVKDATGPYAAAGIALGRWQTDEAYYFVARIGDGEARGIAQRRGPGLFSDLESAAVLYGGEYKAMYGSATLQSNGQIDCIGRCDALEGVQTLSAFGVAQ